MKKTLLVVLISTLAAVAAVAEKKPKADAKVPAKVELKTDAEKLSYALGADIGSRLKDLETNLDLKVFLRGMEDRLKDAEPALSVEEQNQVKQDFFNKKKEEAQAKTKELSEKNRREGELFLAENRRKPTVKTTTSGLQYEVLEEGTGDSPKPADRVKVNYRGTLLDGTEFDSSYKRGQPAVFPISGVIRGWTEGLQLMKVGSKYKFYIPADLAYGERGAGKDIAPNATLVFEVELLGIEPPSGTPAPQAAPESQPAK